MYALVNIFSLAYMFCSLYTKLSLVSCIATKRLLTEAPSTVVARTCIIEKWQVNNDIQLIEWFPHLKSNPF